jgi:uncharacterized membrane protein
MSTIVYQAMTAAATVALASLAAAAPAPTLPAPADAGPLYTYTLAQDGTQASYDEAMAVATLQGIINRKGPRLYLLSRKPWCITCDTSTNGELS